MNCPKCGNEVEPGAMFCGNCGQQLVAQSPVAPQGPVPPPQQTPPQPVPPVVQAVPVMAAPVVATQPVMPQAPPQVQTQSPVGVPAYAIPHETSSVKPVLGLVLGIISMFIWLIPVLGLVISIAAIVLGAMSLTAKDKKGMAIVALVLGIISALPALVVFVAFLASLMAGDSLSGFIHLAF